MKKLETFWGQATLTYVSVNRHHINFCVEIDPANREEFSEQSIAEQTTMALGLWLKPINKVLGHDVTVSRVDCSSLVLDLEVKVAPSPILLRDNIFVEGKTDYALSPANKPFAIIRIDTSYKMANGERIYNFGNIAEDIAPGRVDLHQAMYEVNSSRMQIRDFARWARVDDDPVRLSTYPNILHELGHGFGLCDTADAEYELGCDMNYVSARFHEIEGVMKVINYLYLTDDDQEGVSELAKRFVSMVKKDARRDPPRR